MSALRPRLLPTIGLLAVLALVPGLLPRPTLADQADAIPFFDGAHANFAQIDGCLRTTIDLLGMRQRVDPPPDPGAWQPLVEIFVQQEDLCAGGEDRVRASESGPPISFSFRRRGNLAGASLAAIVPIHDFATGTDTTIALHLKWHAAGSVTSTEQPADNGYLRIDEQRPASAAGRVVLAGIDLTAGEDAVGAALSRGEYRPDPT